MSQELLSDGSGYSIVRLDRKYLGGRLTILEVDGDTGELTAGGLTISPTSTGTVTFGGKLAAGATTFKVLAAASAAVPVTTSGSVAITTAAAETNTLANPTFLGQTLSLFCDTYAVGNRVITAAARINQAGNTIMTFGAVGDFIKLEAITIAGALRWQVISNDGVSLS